ncbi:MAG: DUF3575 domain-containing protein [Myxococcota bacterium]|nr:DUF3575 domain-containing protein [Myxococcota bacterium]
MPSDPRERQQARALSRVLVATAALFVLLLASGASTAEGIDDGVRFKPVALQGNPLGLVVGRYSADLEFLPEPHHALHLTAIGYYALPGVDDSFRGFGAELGYRWYAGEHGAHGIFAGASFLVGEYRYVHTTANQSILDMPDDTQFLSLGGAVDGGFQAILLGNLTVGAGAGIQFTADTARPHFEYVNHAWHDAVYGPGVRPRILVSIGAAF